MLGVLAAQLAEKGFDASPVSLEGDGGFSKLYGSGDQFSSVVKYLGSPYALERIMLKAYPPVPEPMQLWMRS